jgi:HPt (histidine-containing phosphotransfer) domain-containing protein
VQDASKVLAILKSIVDKNDFDNAENMRSYLTNIHGIKSVLAAVGKMDLSATAKRLEMAGKNGEREIITSETPVFISALQAFVEGLTSQEPDEQ